MKNIQDILEYKIIDLENFTLALYHILIVIAIIALTKLALLAIKKVMYREQLTKKIGPGKQHALFQIIKYFLIVIAIAIVLESIGIKVTILLAGSAALLVGLGFGLQQTFSDFISGIILLFEGTIKIGEIIEVEGIVGRVKKIGLRTTEIETRDDIIMIMPNSKFTAEKVINWSHNMKYTRFIITVGVAYGSDTELVKNVLLECANENNFVANNPEPRVRFKDFGDSSLDFELLFYSDNMFRIERVKSDIRFMIDKKFRENGIHIPFPQRDVHVFDKAGKGKGTEESKSGDVEKK
ncbi:MAG: mechanosensitive ion channel domain-containing protein [Bacteroidota bacterium]